MKLCSSSSVEENLFSVFYEIKIIIKKKKKKERKKERKKRKGEKKRNVTKLFIG